MVDFKVTYMAYLGVVGFTMVERLVELFVANQNYKRSMLQGGVEFGASHYKFMVLMHSLFLSALVAEPIVFNRSVTWSQFTILLVVVIMCQFMRWWVIKTLGSQWNTRVVVIPGATKINGGPFKYLNHPNYLIVAIEIIALPLLHNAWITAVVFSLANGFMMKARIEVENEALRLLGHE